ncbi:diguanylate cyclase/phosphodiesterase with integral membrane sensor [Pseudomonas sp. GM41(2012)]|uniref:cyclic di-GMP receptor LapD n=1 Tax=Pseudomonas sp. (strain GM41(2012)) TaxID=1144708 RepID=UPI0002700167|nr:EAL domain-containing protein [Pseudomonas sp. GM41(2012)]EUB72253.1 diguanylate cyclase/phosphodiesterase with integral membrane sensor [Pseudomonas sp. GM41(2012)]
MSLRKQLFLAICLFLLVAFSGSFFVSLESSRDQMLSQLRSHAQDAATALGLSLTAQIDDPAMIELMVSSIFDSGYFSSIRIINIEDAQVLVERSVPGQIEGVPAWFVNLVNLHPPGGEALIMRGWVQAARVEVLSNPQFALAKLWDSTLGSLIWLLVCGLLSAVFGGWLLRRQFRPLESMVKQAEAISKREFLSLPKLPRTPELKRVVLAMNQMVEKLKALFAEEVARSEKLRVESYQDSLTGLANRRLLDEELADELLVSEQSSDGHLLMLRINDLVGLNQRLGGQRTDALISAVGELLKRLTQPPERRTWLAARNRGGEFSLLTPGLDSADAARLASEISATLENLRLTGASDSMPVAHLGIAPYHPGEPASDVLTRLDQALTEARQHPERPWVHLADSITAPTPSQNDWQTWIDDALNQGKMQLYFQPVVQCADTSQVLHHKVLARLLDPQGEAIAAGHFLPWIERLGWSARFDLAMLEATLDYLIVNRWPLALSLSGSTLRDPAQLQHILDMLESLPELAPLLILEIDERQLPPQEELQRLSHSLLNTGYRIGLQHFGGSFGQIGNLAQLGLAYLKIDGAYIRHIDEQSDKKLFIEAIFRATNSIDLPLIAEMVETKGELEVIRELGLFGVMGRLIGPPEPM